MENKKRWGIPTILNKTVTFIEWAIALALVAVIIFLFIQLVVDSALLVITEGTFDFSDFLSQALNLIIGIEFTSMLYKHTPDTIIDVLLFTTARYLIVDHSSPYGSFLGIISIGILFAIKKYLIVRTKE